MGEPEADVIIAGGGPAGSVLAWELARKGVRTLVLERARFPREKVCGDFVDPRGVQILQAMGCLERLERARPPSIGETSTFVEWECHYSGPIPFYGLDDRLPTHGYAIARDTLDAAMLDAAARAGAIIHEQTAVTGVEATAGGVEVLAERGSASTRYTGRLIAGADGVNSVVARSQGLHAADPKRTVVARRAYAYAPTNAGEEAASEVFFDESLFPGYGWVFPAGEGRVNLGVGILSETRGRVGARVPQLFEEFVANLRRHRPRCADLELCSKPIGGIVRTYGAAPRNHFDGGLLVGDAGSFVNPMTGEGITPGMESSLLAAPALLGALERGEGSAAELGRYERSFHAYFDPSMVFLEWCAAALRNRHLARPWLRGLARGCQVSQADPAFARTSMSYFGGIGIQPFAILGQLSRHVGEEILMAWPRLLAGRPRSAGSQWTSPGDLVEWQAALAHSALRDPAYHLRWTIEVQQQWARLIATQGTDPDPRASGLLEGTG